jgi:CelD/BcsL family acetyltransferase involved in cellulose biosynthesis
MAFLIDRSEDDGALAVTERHRGTEIERVPSQRIVRSAAFPCAEILADASPRVTVYRDIGQIGDRWRQFEAGAHATPYQHYDWTSAYAETIGAFMRLETIAAVLESEAGATLLILPLSTRRQYGLRVAERVGGDHANFYMPLFAPEILKRLTPGVCRLILQQVARQAAIDVFSSVNQPVTWLGLPNPFAALGGSPSPSPGFRRDYNFTAEQTFSVILSSESRKKVRKKERLLTEIGPLMYCQAESETQVDAIVEAFLEQKAARLRQKNVTDPFRDEATRAFLRTGALRGLSAGRPAIELYALYLGDAIVATFGGTSDGRRFCGMFNSFCMDPEISKWSPGDLLLLHVIEHQCRRGLATFDLGVGAAPYKLMICDSQEELVDLLVPATPAGSVYTTAVRAARRAKQMAKHAWQRYSAEPELPAPRP